MTLTTDPPAGLFPKANRLRRRSEFKRVYAGERKIHGKHVVVFLSPREEDSSLPLACRLGITATRKIGGAVTRNLLKRRVREIYRQLPARGVLPPAASADFVLNLKGSASDAPFEALRADIERIWSQLAEVLR